MLRRDKDGQIIGKTDIFIADSANADAFGRLRVSSPFGIFDNKNIDSKNSNQWEEKLVGVEIGYDTLTLTFQIGEEVRSDGELIPLGTITADTGSVLTIDCNHNTFAIGDGLTGQTSGATANVTSTNTGSDIQHDYDNAGVDLTVNTGATDIAIRQTHRYYAYVPGKSQLVVETFLFDTGKVNVRKRVGLFDDLNGIYLEQNGTTDVALSIRSNVTGSVIENRVAQEDWNLDKMDGTGASQITLDLTKTQILLIDFQWLGVGRVRIGFDIGGKIIHVHEYTHANILDVVYMRTSTLPVRYEIANLAGTASSSTMRELCSSIASEGGYLLPGFERSITNEITPREVSTTLEPVIAVRLKDEFPTGKPNRRSIRFLGLSFMVATNNALIKVQHVHSPLDITATWTDFGGDSGMEFSTDISAFTGRPTHELINVFAPTAQAGKANARDASGELINKHGFISQSIDSDNSEMFIISARSFTGNSLISASMNLLESI